MESIFPRGTRLAAPHHVELAKMSKKDAKRVRQAGHILDDERNPSPGVKKAREILSELDRENPKT